MKQGADQHTIEALRQENKKLKFESDESKTKLSVLQDYFKNKEIEMQRYALCTFQRLGASINFKGWEQVSVMASWLKSKFDVIITTVSSLVFLDMPDP